MTQDGHEAVPIVNGGASTEESGPAFPSHGSMGEVAQQGMSLRDYFAAKAPAEYLAVMTELVQKAGDTETPVANIMAAAAFMYADAMLAERDAELKLDRTARTAQTQEGFRKCEFCGCLTNAKLRACCNQGRTVDMDA